MTRPRIAIVLFNLGGPESQAAVKPFLFNLFRDPAIIGLPNPLRFLIAKLISSRRAPVAREIYQHMGGGSPLRALTHEQAAALRAELEQEMEVETFISMRYWHPMSEEAAHHVREYAPDHIIALPLYPHFSTTTTASSFKDWDRAARKKGLSIPTRYVCCYPLDAKFIQSHASLIKQKYLETVEKHGKARILFSAHGLPEITVKRGDPYQWQIEQTTQAVLNAVNLPSVDYVNCYQSRVGPMQWIKPATDDEIRRAGADGIPLVVVPIAFVSEHSETLVELDIEYGKLAEESGVPFYTRIPALGTDRLFVQALADICRESAGKTGIAPAGDKGRICPPEFSQCACKAN